MANKLGHFVDTRRDYGWDINGKPDYTSGYGIYSASKDFFEEKSDKSLREAMIKHQHCCDAYAYCVPSMGRPMLAAYRKRTDDEKKAAEEADEDNRVSYIAEWLVGNFERYAFEYIESPFWQNIYRPIADFYANEKPVPFEEPIDETNVPASNISRHDIKSFVDDGREDAVKAAVWALLRQYDLPEAKRKFIVIRETEANVRKWIAAIGYCLPIQAANQISFNTCMEKLNQETDCCYYVQTATGMYAKIRNIQDPNQERRWFYMIAGADPSDRSSDRTANPLPNAVYLLIDGATKQAKFETDALMSRAFMKDVVTNDAAIMDFCSYMNEMQNVQMGTNLCDLYDAQNILTNETAWNYERFCYAINLFKNHFTKRSVLMRYVLSRLCIEGVYAEQFIRKDENNRLNLLSILYKLVSEFEMTEAIPAIQQTLVQRLCALLGNSRNAEKQKSYIGCLKEVDERLYTEVIAETVKTTKVSMVTVADVEFGSEAYVLMLVEMIDTYLRREKQGWDSFFAESDFECIADALIARSLKDEKMPGRILNLFAGDKKAIESYVIKGCRFNSGNNQMQHWWGMMIQNGVSAEHLCDLISSNNIGIQEIKNVLCQDIRLNGYSENLRRLFNRWLAKVPGAGDDFYRVWIESIAESKDRITMLRRILSEMAANTNYVQLFNETLVELDAEIQLDKSEETTELAEMVYEFALRTTQQCRNAMLWKYLYTMSSVKVSRRDRAGIAAVYVQANPWHCRFPASEKMMYSQLGGEFMKCMQEHDEQPATHIIVLDSFDFYHASAEHAYVCRYAKMIASDTVKKRNYALASVLYLREMTASGRLMQVQGADKLKTVVEPEKLMRQLDELLAAIQVELGSVRTDNMSTKMVAAVEKDYGMSVANALERMFADAQEIYRIQHQGQSIFTKIFSRLKK